MNENSPPPTRRALLGTTAAAGVAGIASLGAPAVSAPADGREPSSATSDDTGTSPLEGPASMLNTPFEARDTVRIGLIGLGNRGASMASGWAAVPGAVVTAVCDIRADRATRTADALEADGHSRPQEFGGDQESFHAMLEAVDLDLVYVATPWEFHHAHGKAALLAGAHAAVELPIATELEGLWDLVRTSEETKLHLLLAENCAYGRKELSMLRASHAGLFGDLTSGHGAYLHDLRELLFADGYYTDDWRRIWHTTHNRSFYHMHGLAPIANAMDINRGDRIVSMTATATPALALADYRDRVIPKDHRSWRESYVKGDRTTVLHTTERGRVIRTEHDVSSPQPYSRINSLAGSRGIVEDYVPVGETSARVYVEPDHSGHAWREWDPYGSEFDHWLWQHVGDDAAANGGHGGMDFILQWRTVQQIRLGLVPDIDVYDSATWCASSPLSEVSIADGGATLAFPDFTRGGWQELRRGIDSEMKEMP